MRIRAYIPIAAITAVLLAMACLTPIASAATRSKEKEYGEPKDDKALVYLIRTKRLLSAMVPMHVYAGDELLGVLANNCYTYAYIDPGERILWNDWERANRQFEFEPGKTYYFSAWAQIDELPRVSGMRLIQKVKFCGSSPSDKVLQLAKRQVADRTGDGQTIVGATGSERRIARWPRVDLSGFSILVIEDFKVTDPKAAERKKRDLLRVAPARVANLVRTQLDPATFDEVRRGELEQPIEAAVILRVELTKYKPGSKIEFGTAKLDFTARLIDGGTGDELATFSNERARVVGRIGLIEKERPGNMLTTFSNVEGYAWHGGRIDIVEKVVAFELATYLERQTGAGVAETPEESAPAPD